MRTLLWLAAEESTERGSFSIVETPEIHALRMCDRKNVMDSGVPDFKTAQMGISENVVL